MSDTASRTPTAAAQMLADALLRTVAGATAYLQVTGSDSNVDQSQIGLLATTFAEVAVSPAVMRKLRPGWQEGGQSKWELLISATGVAQAVNALDLTSAESLFQMTLSVSLTAGGNGQSYLIESIAANEAMGQVYLYRMLLREAGTQAI
jgi:hypothetical protein